MLLWMSEEVGNKGKHSQQTNQFNQNNSELHLNNCLITLLLPFATNNSLMSDQMVETKKKNGQIQVEGAMKKEKGTFQEIKTLFRLLLW